MKNKIDIAALEGLGLTNYEVRIYTSLLQKKQLSATEIARIAEIPRTRVYDDLKSLETKGLCQVVIGKTKLFSAANPAVIRDVLIKIGEEKINQKKEKLEQELQKEKEKMELNIRREKEKLTLSIKNVESVIEQLGPIYNESRDKEYDMDYIQVVKNKYQDEKIFMELISESKTEILSLVKQRFPIFKSRPSALKQQIKVGTGIIRKGVSVKCIYELYPDDEKNDYLFNNVIENYAHEGEQVRVSDALPLRMAIFDEKVAMFSLSDPVPKSPSSTTQIVRHPVMAKSLKILFETLWERSEDYDEYKQRVKKKR